MVSYVETTNEIEVTVRPVYLDGQSDLMNRRFVFGYFVRIDNNGFEEVQLLRRHWHIRDGNGQTREVEGEGVIGIQPLIGVGEFHEYNSFCVLGSFEGSMHGTYLMERTSGERFKVNIPRFFLTAAAN
ncbi:MAG: Co2+/Mg2+ efflux protein ApaG [Rhodothermales bacterium]|nr:Co2+/Mg2+ efflux protein ApaG [Rhodothermales bacterium]